MNNAGVLIAVILVVTWTAQTLLSVRQLRRYFRRVNELRRNGRVATGMGGSRYRGRVYGVLAVDPKTQLVVRAEQLSGWTVFAGLKPIPQLQGLPLDSILDDPATLASFSPREAVAFRAAAQTLHDSFHAPAESGDVSTASDVKSGPTMPTVPTRPKGTSASVRAGRLATATVKE